MTRVEYSPAARRLRLTGHAGAGERGSDPVCAALSILVYALLDAGAEGRVERGEAELLLPDRDVDVALCGFRLLAESYPEYVSYKESKMIAYGKCSFFTRSLYPLRNNSSRNCNPFKRCSLSCLGSTICTLFFI